MSKLAKKVVSSVVALTLCFTLLSPAFANAATNYGERWTNGKGTVNCSQNSGGKLVGSWSSERGSGGNMIISVGWNNLNLAGKKIGYNCGQFQNNNGSNGCSYLMFYGWTRSPLVEYYIIENWHNFSNNTGTNRGSFSANGGTYNIFTENKTNQPSIVGNSSNFTQMKSVRTSANGTGSNKEIDLNAHVTQWRSKAGFSSSPTWAYGVMAFEGYESKGAGNLSVWAAGGF